MATISPEPTEGDGSSEPSTLNVFAAVGIFIAGLITAATADIFLVRIAGVLFFFFSFRFLQRGKKLDWLFEDREADWLAGILSGCCTLTGLAIIDFKDGFLWSLATWVLVLFSLGLIMGAATGAYSAALAPTFEKTQRRRQAIPKNVRMYVWQRDEGRCVECGSKENLEYDHIIPFSRGGSSTDRNLQLLCETCNRQKGASI